MSKKHEHELTWGDVMWSWIKRGYPREEAAFRADNVMAQRERERASETRLNLTLADKEQALLHVTETARNTRNRA